MDINKWTHVVYSDDGIYMYLYINNELVAKKKRIYQKYFSNDEPINIGYEDLIGNDFTYNYYLNSKVDDLRIYNRALNKAEIAELYKKIVNYNFDSDYDGILDGREFELGLNPDLKDSDADGILDNIEIGDINNPLDTDGDEIIDALDLDSDNDGFGDRDEVEAGTDPKDKNDYPDNEISNKIFEGVWKGKYTCSQGLTGLTLTIKSLEANKVEALFYFYPIEENPNIASGKYLMTGEYNGDYKLDLIPNKWIDKPNNYVMVPLYGNFNSSFTSYNGRISFSGTSCTTFSLYKDISDE